MTRFTLAALSAVAICLASTSTVPANDTNAAPTKAPSLPSTDTVTKGMEKVSGFLTFYLDEEKGRLLAEIPAGLLNTEMHLATSITRGPAAGFQWSDMLLRIEKQNEKAVFVEPDTFHTAQGRLKDVVRSTYPDSVVATTPIIGGTAGGAILIDLKALLTTQPEAFIRTKPQAQIVEVAKAKSFPDNSVVELNYRQTGGGTGVYFSFSRLMPSDYKPRVADERVGYFITARRNLSMDERSDTTFERYINRWHLEKADPDLSLSPPREPIVFYIEDSVPVKYRRFVREGIEMWNRAFEKIGYSEAIVVRQQTANNEFANLDPEDVRYNFFRWTTSGRAFAMGPSRVDPRTGQILDADIIMDESMVRFYVQDFDLFVNSTASLRQLSPRLRQMLAHDPTLFPDWPRLRVEYAMRIDQDPRLAGLTPETLLVRELVERPEHRPDTRYCSIGDHLQQEVYFSGLALRTAEILAAGAEVDDATAPEGEEKEEEKEEPKDAFFEWPEEFIGSLVREIVAHEVGHTLGLRHNFKGSTWLAYEDIINATDPNAPTVGSVMDYNAVHYRADGEPPQNWMTPALGPYDLWAIEYGYAVPGSAGYPAGEEEMLKQVVAKVTQDGHDYATDEDLWSLDPSVNMFDLGEAPLEHARARIELASKIEARLLDAVVQDEQSYARARRAYEILLFQRTRAAFLAARHIGGAYHYRDHKGDPNARTPINPVPAQEQRAALAMLNEVLFATDAIVIDPELQRHLASGRWAHRGSNLWRESATYPIQDNILSMQRMALFQLLNPERVQELYNTQFRVAEEDDLFTLPELFEQLTGNVWGEVLGETPQGTFTARHPMIEHLRRNLQRAYLAQLIRISTSGEQSFYPTISRTLAWRQLKNLGEHIDAVLIQDAGRLDPYTLAHLEESRGRIQQALEAQFTVGGPAFGFGFGGLLGQPADETGHRNEELGQDILPPGWDN